ncbi:HupE/UreJ family protein [Ruegeria sp. HKCCSP351]|uniref:HupE/UreJ family protein n=1 Tax=Ruegeria sp. HKCCSP351 TaxID=2794832 RepID=UPI001AE81379|nr:HupE/UreJ family protein [Ruegeria sp. HKCCSP351]
MKRFLVPLFAIFAICLPGYAPAHALDPGYLELASMGQERWRVTWRAPDVNGRKMPIEARLPANCSHEPSPSPSFDGRAWTTGWIATCPGGLESGVIEIVGLEQTNTETLVRYELEPGQTQVRRLTSTETAFTVPENPGFLDILSSYVALGVTHILEGLDHLLFVFALVLLVRDLSRLLWAITAFTVAHSITLASATLGWLNIPPPPVEAVIALSIVFLAYELSLSPENRDPLATRSPWIVAFAFGLIHGLGFAGALREIGLPDGDIPLALFAFNLGVELGQVLFIVVVLTIGFAARLLYPAIKEQAVQLERVTSYGIGSLAAFWVIERIAGF